MAVASANVAVALARRTRWKVDFDLTSGLLPQHPVDQIEEFTGRETPSQMHQILTDGDAVDTQQTPISMLQTELSESAEPETTPRNEPG